jgi:hypothetical protein
MNSNGPDLPTFAGSLKLFPEPKRQLAFKWLASKSKRKTIAMRTYCIGQNVAHMQRSSGAIAAVIGAIGAGKAAWPVIREWIAG